MTDKRPFTFHCQWSNKFYLSDFKFQTSELRTYCFWNAFLFVFPKFPKNQQRHPLNIDRYYCLFCLYFDCQGARIQVWHSVFKNVNSEFLFVKTQCVAFQLKTHLIIDKVSRNKNSSKGHGLYTRNSLSGGFSQFGTFVV